MTNISKFLLALLILVPISASAQTKNTENTLLLPKGEKGQPAKVSDLEWIAGTWTGNALGGSVKEVWTRTDGGGLIGMFALVKEKKPVFYELLTFVVEDGQLLLKLKHFNPDLIGWEEKEKTVNFRFIKRNGNKFYFSGLTFENAGPDKLNIYLALRRGEKKWEEAFRLTRTKD